MFQFFLSNFVRLNRIIIIDEIYKLELDIKGRKIEIVLSRKFNSNKIEVSSNSGGTNFSGMTFNGGNTEIYMSNADRSGSASYTASVNFGNPNADNAPSSSASDANGYGNFEFAPPSGFYSLCTKNIAEFG